MTVTEFLTQHVPFLHGIAPERAHALAVAAQQRSYAHGQTVVFRGTTIDGLFIVASGKVGVWVKPPRGGAPILAAELGAGEVFGEASLLDMGTAGATIKAMEDETLVFMLPQDAFFEALAADPALRARAEALMHERKTRNAALKPEAN